jgi:uncharacterized membrane protein (UPF0127 family)
MDSPQPLSVVKLKILDHIIAAEVADTPAARMNGLMQRTYLPENSGMLFIFPEVSIHCMWMKDTVIPLSVAFLDEMGKIINLAEMVPETLIPHCSVSAARYALEMNSGWFTARKIKVGDRTIEAINSGSIW